MRRIKITGIIALLAFACPQLFARHAPSWTVQELFDAADYVVIAEPIESQDDKDAKIADPSIVPIKTTLQVKLELKGKDGKDKITLYHHRIGESVDLPLLGPDLINFEFAKPGWKQRQYILFLKRIDKGKYSTVSDPIDENAAVRVLSKS